MTNSKKELYQKLKNAYVNHANKNTLCDTYVNNVLKIINDYIKFNLNPEYVKKLKNENQELKNIIEADIKDLQELRKEKERWRKLCLCWREAYIECDEKFHNLCKEVLKDDK